METLEKVKRIAELFKVLKDETMPIDGHDDTGAIDDCWDEAADMINELYKRLQTGVEEIEKAVWTWIVNHDCSDDKVSETERQFEKKFHGNIGKYLFFSKNREELVELAKEALVKHDLYHAKTPTRLRPDYDKFVLCVYDTGPNLIEEMKKYETDSIEYRYWKSDEATIKGVEQNEL